METVSCSKCGGPRVRGERCKPCRKSSKHANYVKNRDRNIAYSSQWRLDNLEHVKATKKKHYAENAEALREYSRQYYASHKEERSAYHREWRKSDPEAIKQYDAAQYQKRKEYHKQWWARYAAANREYLRARDKKRLQENREQIYLKNERRKVRLLECQGFHTLAEWKAILKKHRNRCANCGTKDNLTKDHIVPLARGGTNFAYNLQPLCRSCNSRKRADMESGTQHSLFDKVAA